MLAPLAFGALDRAEALQACEIPPARLDEHLHLDAGSPCYLYARIRRELLERGHPEMVEMLDLKIRRVRHGAELSEVLKSRLTSPDRAHVAGTSGPLYQGAEFLHTPKRVTWE